MINNGDIKVMDFGLCKTMKDTENTKIDLTSQGHG